MNGNPNCMFGLCTVKPYNNPIFLGKSKQIFTLLKIRLNEHSTANKPTKVQKRRRKNTIKGNVNSF